MAEKLSEGFSDALGGHTSNPPEDRTSGYPLIIGGKEYTVSSCEQRIKGQFELWVRGGVSRLIADLQKEKDYDLADALQSKFAGEYGAGHYSWDGKYCRAAKQDAPGLTHLLFLLIRRCDAAIKKETVEDLVKENLKACILAVAWALGNSPAPTPQEVQARLQALENEETEPTLLIQKTA